MAKKHNIDNIDLIEDLNMLPEIMDGKHQVIPIMTGGDEPVEDVKVRRCCRYSRCAARCSSPDR